MRVLFLVLLLANIATLLIALFAGSSGSPSAHPELNPEKIRLLGPDDPQKTDDKKRN
jgi:hypothetical protein